MKDSPVKKSWVRNGGAKASPVGIVVVYGSERETRNRGFPYAPS